MLALSEHEQSQSSAQGEPGARSHLKEEDPRDSGPGLLIRGMWSLKLVFE